ncbi:hypothetical protein V8C37DRAFT_160565 [Trichoderma ceciliae]
MSNRSLLSAILLLFCSSALLLFCSSALLLCCAALLLTPNRSWPKLHCLRYRVLHPFCSLKVPQPRLFHKPLFAAIASDLWPPTAYFVPIHPHGVLSGGRCSAACLSPRTEHIESDSV